MGFSVNTNIDALNTYRNLNNVQNSLSSSLAKLSSGLRINNAGDDAAGLTIATSLGSQVSGLTQAARNAQDGTSVVQTADGALSQAQSLLQRLRDLAVQAGNDSNSPSARVAIKTEAKSITDELDRLGDSVNFNGTKLLNGQTPVLKFQIGADGDAASQVTVNLSGANLKGAASALGNGSYSSGTTVKGIVVANVPSTLNFVVTSPDAKTVSNVAVSGLTAPTSLQGLADQLNASSAFSSKMTAVVGRDADGTPTGLVLSGTDGSTVNVKAADLTTLGVSGGAAATETTAAPTVGIQFDSADNAQLAITAIQAQLEKVTTARANIGAAENRFASAVSTINTSITNLTAAKSRITDVDMAQEMVNYSRANILSQSGTAMLAQANALPQLALKLLQG